MFRFSTGSLFAAAALAGTFLSTAVLAQSANEVLLDTIVLGERLERSLTDTYSSVSVLGPDEIEKEAAGAHINDLLTATPNLFVEGVSEVPSLRGVQGGGAGGVVSASLTGALPRLSYVIDGVNRPAVLPNSNGASLWDVEQVEVLRGPQSLLRGRSALAGAIIVETADPSFTPEAAVQSGVKIDEFHRPEYTLNAMVSGPLTSNWAGRMAVEYSGGEDPRRATDVPDDWIVDYNNLRMRGKLLGEMETSLGGLTIEFLGELQQGQTPQTRNTVQTPLVTGLPLDDRVLVNAVSGPLGIPARTFDTTGSVLSVDAALDTGVGTFRAVLSYVDDSYVSIPEQVYPFPFDVKEHSFHQDLTYEFGPGERVKAGEVSGIVGASFEQRNQVTDITGLLTFKSDGGTDSQAAYADMRYGITDDLTVFGGARVQRYNARFDQLSSAVLGVNPATGMPIVISGNQTFAIDETEFLPSLGLAYYFNDDTVVSGSVRRGYNPAGSSVNIFTGQPYVYESEFVTTGEITFRQTLPDQGVQYGITAFYNMFEKPQLYAELQPGNRASLQVINQEKGISYGLEFDTSWQVNEKLTLNGSLGLLETQITEASAFNPALKGNSFGQDPSITASIGAEHQILENLSIDGRATYRGASFNDFNEVPTDKVGDYWIVDLGATAEFGNVEARAFVNNVFNETGVTRFVGGGTFADVTKPLTAGLTLTARF
ncbi:TonB-dependent receptor [Oceaniradius stylonematis]|uniref:TonB-dependent receptor n=1 Tax=Oceaniradius stylonematis TaxID=2184161 RepID=UPI00273F15F7|nr:TonB-dependent receptor [Oceaniradius stylonematis]